MNKYIEKIASAWITHENGEPELTERGAKAVPLLSTVLGTTAGLAAVTLTPPKYHGALLLGTLGAAAGLGGIAVHKIRKRKAYLAEHGQEAFNNKYLGKDKSFFNTY
jgi:hypothetical protein